MVNVILKKDYEGAEANAYYGQFDENDGQREAYDVTIGAVGADGRFSGMLGASYVEEMPVWAGDREISSEPIIGTGTFFGSSTTPYGRFQLCDVPGFSGAPLSCPGANRVRPDGSAGQ